MNTTRHLHQRLTAALVATIAFLVPTPPSAISADAAPQRLRRADSYLGIHFDFHAGPDCTEVGKNTTPEMVENILRRVRPDYLQIDCKGHPGYSSYPTKVGQPVPGFVGDPLRVWRDVTARHGVGLYLHYSGVFDSHAVLQPGWAALNADGKPSTQATSFFGPYADQLLIPQLRELAGVYGVDGVWVDGECWSAVPDYGAAAIAAFQKATGIQEIPRKRGEPHWFEFQQFHREAFRNYLRHYITEVKKTHPDFQMCSNWAYTDHMAEPLNAPVDFLSGDYSPEDSVNSARISARYLVRQGKPWDLMAWSFTTKPGRSQKSAVQLQREAAVVIALGGGFQAYHKQKRDGSIFDEQMIVMGEVAKFCRERQALCHHSEPVPQVALLLSTAAHYRKINGLFNRDLGHVQGILHALLESQFSVEVVGEHQLTGRLSEYPILIVPEWDYLEPAFKTDLVAYVKGGGNLLLLGPQSAGLFRDELGVTWPETQNPSAKFSLDYQDQQTALSGPLHQVLPAADTRTLGRLTAVTLAHPASPASSIRTLGRGTIAATYFTLGPTYRSAPSDALRQFLNDLVRELFPNPMVEVTGTHDVDVVLARQRGQLLVNLVNTSGPHRTEPILDAIPPIGPLKVAIRQANKPSKVTLEPSGTTLAFQHRDGILRVEVPQVAIHEAVVVTP
jgi:hypothetical protein